MLCSSLSSVEDGTEMASFSLQKQAPLFTPLIHRRVKKKQKQKNKEQTNCYRLEVAVEHVFFFVPKYRLNQGASPLDLGGPP